MCILLSLKFSWLPWETHTLIINLHFYCRSVLAEYSGAKKSALHSWALKISMSIVDKAGIQNENGFRKLLYASRGAFTANTLYIRVNTQQQTCSTNFKDCKYNCLWEPFHLSKYFHKEQVVLSFLIRQQVTKEIDGIALLPVHVISLIMRKRSILSHVSNYQKGNKEKHQK